MNWREVDFEVRNWTRMAHAHAEALLKLQVCRWIDFSNKKYYIFRRNNKAIHLTWVIALCGAET